MTRSVKRTIKTASGEHAVITRREKFLELTKRVSLVGIALFFFLCITPTQWRLVSFSTTVIFLGVAVAISAMQILNPEKYDLNKFAGFLGGIANWYDNLERYHQLYLNVILFLPVLGYLYLLDPINLFAPTAIIFFIYCLGVAAHDVYRIYAILYETTVGKGLIAIAFAVGSNLALSVSGKIIGGLAHVPPTTFPHTLAFLAIFAIPFLFIAAGAIFIPVSVAMAPFFIYGSTFAKKAPRLTKWIFGVKVNDKGSRYAVATVIFQVIFYLAIWALTPATFFLLLNRYDQQIEWAVGQSIYEFDMYPGTECKMGLSYRQASLGDENYILASKKSTGITFESPKKCAL